MSALLSCADYVLSGVMDNEIAKIVEEKLPSTGYSNLDSVCPLYSGLYVLGAVSSLGKTTFMNQMSYQIATQGFYVVFFSYEQSRLELVSKSMSRLSYQLGTPVTALDIRALDIRHGSDQIKTIAEQYVKVAKFEYIVESQFGDTVDNICVTVENFVKRGIKPVVIVDYLQIVSSKNSDQISFAKENVDYTVKKLKNLQRKYNLVVFVVSSLNRQNYLTQIDFESFKESGGIEYTADVVFGMQLKCMNEPIFDGQAGLNKKRERVMKAKSENPRKIELVCLKNRYAKSGYRCYFNYFSTYDCFEVCDVKKSADKSNDDDLLV